MNSTNSQCTALIQFQHLTQIVANMLLTLSSLMVDGNVQNAKTTISRVANHAIVVKNQNLMKTMMASQNICSKQLKRKRSLKYKRIKQKNLPEQQSKLKILSRVVLTNAAHRRL
jgi:hypothetical protein